MNYTKQIEKLMDTDMTNRNIAASVGCSMRMVQHVAGSYRERRGLLQEVINASLPKVLLLDVETAPMESYHWGLFKNVILPHSVIKDWSILSWSAKWLFETDVMSDRVQPKEAFNRTDASVMQGIHDLMDESDIIIAHNGKNFDLKKLNARFIINGFGPPSPYQIIDTLTESRKNFAFSAHNLDWLCKTLKLREGKDKQGFGLWDRCVRDSSEQAQALKDMNTYCDQDVRALEDVYMALRPWIKSHPNMGVYVEVDEPICPTCGNLDITYNGYYRTMVSKFRAFKCDRCTAVGRLRKTKLDKGVRNFLTMSTAR